MRAGEIASIRGDGGEVLLSYRSFAGITGVVAALVSGIVLVAGVAGAAFLFAEGSPLRGAAAIAMTIVFAVVIAMLVPRTNVTLYDDDQPALTISQRSVFPGSTFIVATPNGTPLADLRRSPLARLGRNRWTMWQDERFLGDAVEESFGRAIVRKFIGKFSRRFETDVVIRHGGFAVGVIHRRSGDLLELTSDALDRRVAVALATLILGREP